MFSTFNKLLGNEFKVRKQLDKIATLPTKDE